MKTTVNVEELRAIDVCKIGLNNFEEHFGTSTVKFSEAFKYTALSDSLWYLATIEMEGELSPDQVEDLRPLVTQCKQLLTQREPPSGKNKSVALAIVCLQASQEDEINDFLKQAIPGILAKWEDSPLITK